MSNNPSSMLKPGTLVSGADVLQNDAEGVPPERGGPTPPDLEQEAMALPSGRSVAVVLRDGAEQLEVRAPDGGVEVTVTLTAAGPVVRMASAARLELSAADTVAVECEDFTVDARRAIDMTCTEDMHIKTKKDVFVEGAVIWLN